MADGAVNFLLGKLSTILQQTVLQKASLLSDAHNEIEEIKLVLESMSAFIRDADRRKETDLSVKTWVRQVRDISHKIEDIVDEYMHYKDTGQQTGKGFKNFVQDVVNLPRNVTASYQLSLKLQEIKIKIQKISERSKDYCFDRINEGRSRNTSIDWRHHHGESSSFIDEKEIVGMDESEEKLLEWLTEDEVRRTIISIVGMGGLGKTTLVTKVYNDQIIKRYFDCWAWISVSQTYGVEELLRSMVRELLKTAQATSPRNFGSMNYRQLAEMLIDVLHDKRYVVVLDDVWGIELWSRIRCAFPDNNCGSRIIFTTRNENVATSVGPGSRVHRLEPLRENDAWVLFCNKVFWNYPDHSCPKELEKSAQTIMKKCEGLPLAIVAIGGLMCSRNKTVVEWKKVYDSLNWQLSNNPVLGRVKGMLLLSFNDLPFYLKHCFLYCCVFRDGYPIKRKKLIRLWVAEGFVIERKGLTIEEVAEEYLTELILRSMIQVTETNDCGRVKTCKVHDVMRELAVTTSEEENFCTAYNGQESRAEGKFLRLSVYNRGGNIQLSKNMSRHLRSFFVFETDTCTSFSLNVVSSNFKFLKVLDVEGVSIEIIPGSLINLFNLSHLNLRDTKVRELPKSMERLHNLQTLDVRNTNVTRLPSRISKLLKLRHLFLGHKTDQNSENSNFPHGMKAPAGIWNARSLQTLSCIEAEEELITQVGNLLELKRLDITELRGVHGPKLCSSIQKLTSLRCLGVKASAEEELKLEALSLPPFFLQKLTLVGQLKNLPHWIGSLANLTHLCLDSSRLEQDVISCLHTLSTLVFLELKKAYGGSFLYFRAGWFPKLNKLNLEELVRLDSVRIEDGALPSIKEMGLIRCWELKSLPQGIEHLRSLRKLHLEEMPEELLQWLESDTSEVQAKVNFSSPQNRGVTKSQKWLPSEEKEVSCRFGLKIQPSYPVVGWLRRVVAINSVAGLLLGWLYHLCINGEHQNAEKREEQEEKAKMLREREM
ncbi:unnamed protein product [Camellia sinensis]